MSETETKTERFDEHLGDGVYATFDGRQIFLDLRQQDMSLIALEPEVMQKLKAYEQRTPEFTRQMVMSMQVEELLEMGAYYGTQEDRSGKTKSGWWMDDVWLAPKDDPKAALEAIRG